MGWVARGAIGGFGRVGRHFLRAAIARRSELNIVAINDFSGSRGRRNTGGYGSGEQAAGQNIMPTAAGADHNLAQVIPGRAGRLHGVALRVPVPAGSLTDLTCMLDVYGSYERMGYADRLLELVELVARVR